MPYLSDFSPNDLTPHPLNAKLFGDRCKPDAELVQSVQKGIVLRLVVLPDGTIISGERRRNAAKIAGLKTVPCEVRDDLRDPQAIEEALIIANKQQPMTREQLARMAAHLASIEKVRAEAREKAGVKATANPGVPGHQGSGRTRDVVGDKLGISPEQAHNLIQAGEALEDAEAKGDEPRAEAIKEGLKKGAKTGARVARETAPNPPAPKKPKNGAPTRPVFDEKPLDRAHMDYTRLVDRRNEKFPDPDRHPKIIAHLRAAFHLLEEWRKA